MHARADYNRIQDPMSEFPSTLEALYFAKSIIQSGETWTSKCEEVIQAAINRERVYRSSMGLGCIPIGIDEPVILFRAQDKNFVSILQKFSQLLKGDPEVKDSNIIASVEEQINNGLIWQAKHGCKTPDLPQTKEVKVDESNYLSGVWIP